MALTFIKKKKIVSYDLLSFSFMFMILSLINLCLLNIFEYHENCFTNKMYYYYNYYLDIHCFKN